MKKSNSVCICLMVSTFLSAHIESAPSTALVTPMPYYYNPVATVSPVNRRYPLRPEEEQHQDFEEYEEEGNNQYPTIKSTYFAPSQLLLTLLRTFVDVLGKVNSKRSKQSTLSNTTNSKILQSNYTFTNSTKYLRPAEKRITNVTVANEKARGMDPGVIYDDYHHHHEYAADITQPPPMPMMMQTTEEPKKMGKQSRYTDPWEGYYEFLITEGSFKFWSSFQLATAGLLLYSALAAIYYAKFNPIQPDYDTTYDDYFFGRSLEGDGPMLPPDNATPAPGWISSIAGMGRATYQRIMDAVHATEDKFQ